MKSLVFLLLGILLLFVSTPQHTRAQISSGYQLIPSTINEDQDFGFSVDVYGDVAIVGAFRDEDGILLETGAAFVYRFDGTQWIEEQKLEASNKGTLNWFGWDVALSENIALVSARNGDTFDTNGGDVTLFRYNSGQWTEETILTPSDEVVSDYGFAMDIDGDVIAIGSPGHPGVVAGTTEGAVYVYRYNGTTWIEEDLLFGSDLSNQSLFGSAISIEGDRMLIGAFNADDSTSNQAGKMYVFDFDGAQWNETAVLQSNNSNNIANLGVSVGLEGQWAIGGAQLDSELAGGAGAVYVYHNDGQAWNFHSKLTASDGAGFFLFGIGVAISDQHILIGAENWFDTNSGSTGKAYMFEYEPTTDTWLETAGFVPSQADTGGRFGHSVAMHGNTMILGAPEYSGSQDDMGTAFIYGEPVITTSIKHTTPFKASLLSTPYPNPFSEQTAFTVSPEVNGHTRIALFDLLGREVDLIFDGQLPGGVSTPFNVVPTHLPNGIYWIRINTRYNTSVRSVILQR